MVVLHLLFIRQVSRDYSMKILITLLAAGVIFFTAFFILINEEQRWLILNGGVAEDFATSLLRKDVGIETPDRFIDYSVSSKNGYVLFSKHSDHSVVYGYFPDKTPSEIGEEISNLEWKSLGDNWFVFSP